MNDFLSLLSIFFLVRSYLIKKNKKSAVTYFYEGLSFVKKNSLFIQNIYDESTPQSYSSYNSIVLRNTCVR